MKKSSQITHQKGAQNSDFIHFSFDVIFQTLKQSIYCNASDTCICFWQRSEITLYTRSQIARLLYHDTTKRFETAQQLNRRKYNSTRNKVKKR